MNYSLLTCAPLASHHDEVNDWLSGEAWIIPQPLGIECFGVVDTPHDDDAANDWVPI